MSRSYRWVLALLGVLALALAGCTNRAAERAASGEGGQAASPTAATAEDDPAQPAVQAGGGESHLDRIKDSGKLRVGMTLQFEPQMYRDDDNKPAGYDVELLQIMAKDLGVELDIKDQEFDGLIPGLVGDQFDLISVGLVNRPERAEQIWFSEPYVPYRQVVVVSEESDVDSLDDLNNAEVRITALTGSTAANLVKTNFPQAELVELEQQPAFLEVASGRADAIVVEEYLARPFVAENSDRARILNPDEPFSQEFGAYGLPYGDIEWKVWVDNWVNYHTANGDLDALYRRIIEPTFEEG